MLENKIEKFTDRLFLKTTTSRNPTTNLLLNFKTLPVSKTPKSPTSSPSAHKKQPRSATRSRFRQSRQELGLSKTDIDKLELMCVDFTAEDYLNRLIKIHQEENAVRDQMEVQMIDLQAAEEDNIQEDIRADGDCQKDEEGINSMKKAMGRNSNRSNFSTQPIPIPSQKKANLSQRKSNVVFQNTGGKKMQEKTNQNTKQFRFVVNTPRNNSQKISTSSTKKLFNKTLPKKSLQHLSPPQLPLPAAPDISIATISSNKTSAKQIDQYPTTSPSMPIKIPSIKDKKIVEAYKMKEKEVQTDLIMEQKLRSQRRLKTLKYLQPKQVPNSKKLQQICYSEIGRRMVNIEQKQVHRQYFKANLHIRSYIMKNIVSYIQYSAEYSPDSIFILPNERAIHFDPNSKPKQLSAYLQHTKYVEIIKNVNHIIQKNIFKQKYQEPTPSQWPYVLLLMFALFVIMILLMIMVGNESTQLKGILMVCTGLLICVIMVALFGYALHCYNQDTHFVPVCQIIQNDIDSYFKFINGKMENCLEWIVGESFFWLEVRIHENSNPKLDRLRKKKGRVRDFYHSHWEDSIHQNKQQ